MKYLIPLILFCSEVSAAEYLCRTPLLKIDFISDQEMSEVMIRDAQINEMIYLGFVDELTKDNFSTNFIFKTSSNQTLQLMFKSEDIEANSNTLYGFIKGFTGRGFADQSIKCLKKIEN